MKFRQIDNPFGGCPLCGNDDGMLHVGPDHWLICRTHKTRWWIGSNLFSCWEYLSEEDWEANAKVLASYRVVEAIFFASELWPRPWATIARAFRSAWWAASARVRRWRARLAWLIAGGPLLTRDGDF